jgi:ketosteroid isomerase-like protein
VVQNLELGENVNAEGELEEISIRATNVFRMEDGRWRMIGHHTDLLPLLDR